MNRTPRQLHYRHWDDMPNGKRMKHIRTIQKEYRRVQREVKKHTVIDARFDGEKYGAMQALAWVLGDNACAPTKLLEKP